jgi:predicted flap endonuclease-1-like 5' DNA nuclease
MADKLAELIPYTPDSVLHQLLDTLPPETAVVALIERTSFTLEPERYLAAAGHLSAAQTSEIAARCTSSAVLDLIATDGRPTILDGLARNPALSDDQACALLVRSVQDGPRRAKRIHTILAQAAQRGRLEQILAGVDVPTDRRVNWPYWRESEAWGGSWSSLLTAAGPDSLPAVATSPLVRHLTGAGPLELLDTFSAANRRASVQISGRSILDLIRSELRTQQHPHHGNIHLLSRSHRNGLFDLGQVVAAVEDTEDWDAAYRAARSLDAGDTAARMLLHLVDDPDGPGGDLLDRSCTPLLEAHAFQAQHLLDLLTVARDSGTRLRLDGPLLHLTRSIESANLSMLSRIAQAAGQTLTLPDVTPTGARLTPAGRSDRVDGPGVVSVLLAVCGPADDQQRAKVTRWISGWRERIAQAADPSDHVEDATALARVALALPGTGRQRQEVRRETLAWLGSLKGLGPAVETLLDERVVTWSQLAQHTHPEADGGAILSSILNGHGWGRRAPARAAGGSTAIPLGPLRKLNDAGDDAPTIAALRLLHNAGELGGHPMYRGSLAVAHALHSRIWPERHQNPDAAARILLESGVAVPYLRGELSTPPDPAVTDAILARATAQLTDQSARPDPAGRGSVAAAAVEAIMRDAFSALESAGVGEGEAGSVAHRRLDHLSRNLPVPALTRAFPSWASAHLPRHIQAAALHRQLDTAEQWQAAAQLLDGWQGTLTQLADAARQL